MECKVSELVKRGHDQAAELKASCGAVDVRDVAQLISDLATQLDVQLARSNALAAENAGLKSSVAEVRRQAFNARRNSHNCGPFQYSDLCDSIIDETKVETPATD
ncbi:TPA: hypothetical protein ACF3LI_004603, partial [Enterobacter hormaechei]